MTEELRKAVGRLVMAAQAQMTFQTNEGLRLHRCGLHAASKAAYESAERWRLLVEPVLVGLEESKA